jgi:kynurenine formamidase
MIIRMSYNLSEDFPPALPDAQKLRVEQRDSIGDGSPLNSFGVWFANHLGTHIDAPYHFNPSGMRIVDFPITSYVFDAPLVVEVPKDDTEYVTRADLVPWAGALAHCDLVLLRTGFWRHRFTDPVRYAQRNPGLAGDAARYLLDHCSRLRAVGIDAVSIEFEAHYGHEFAAHRALLCDDDRPMLIIEDVDLSFDGGSEHAAGGTRNRLVRVTALPLFIEGIDASPCSVLGELAGG